MKPPTHFVVIYRAYAGRALLASGVVGTAPTLEAARALQPPCVPPRTTRVEVLGYQAPDGPDLFCEAVPFKTREAPPPPPVGEIRPAKQKNPQRLMTCAADGCANTFLTRRPKLFCGRECYMQNNNKMSRVRYAKAKAARS